MKNTAFASDRRSIARKASRQKDMWRAQSFIQSHLSLNTLYAAYQADQCMVLFQSIESNIETEANSVRYKKMLYHCYRKQITLFNQNYSLEIELPTRQFITIERDHMVFDREWLQRSKYSHHLQQKLWRYWHTRTQFSDAEVIGNVLLSSILFAGISTQHSLDAFFEQLKDELSIQHLPAMDLHLVFLEPLSPHYGDVYNAEASLRKSRTLVLDRMTQLWLSRFFKQPSSLHNAASPLSASAYLSLVLYNMGLPGQAADLSKLFACASSHLMQLPDIFLDPALTRCLEESNETCGLSLNSFQHYFNPVLSSSSLSTDVVSTRAKVQPSLKPIHDTRVIDQDGIVSLKKLHKHILKILRDNTACLATLIDYIQQEHLNLSEPAMRICLWLISLFQPSTAQVEQLSHLFGLDLDAWLKYLRYQQKLRRSSIYTYYAKFAEAWLFHSDAYSETPDFNHYLEDIYTQALGEKQKSSDQKMLLLRRFHHFQKVLFQAEDFPLFSDVHAAAHPKTEIISAKSFCAVLDLLPTYISRSHFNIHDSNMLSIIFNLAFRTGMRINEILGLRVKDVEGPACSSIWIRPYRVKQQQHQLKTDSAERNLPVSILLKPDEYEAFEQYCISKRISSNQNDYLFTLWNHEERLTTHWVSQVFSHLIHTVLPNARYSFHSLRHSAANHLALVLNMPYEMVSVFTDYTQEDYVRIRAHLLRCRTAQDTWYCLAHLLGHISPKESFKSYIHLAFIMAGYRLAQYDPALPVQTIRTIHPDLDIKSSAKPFV